MNRSCATMGCAPPQGTPGVGHYDHLGRIRRFCIVHSSELKGVRQSIKALLDQISGLQMVSACTPFDPMSPLRVDIDSTMREQGALLVQLIKRERELTGAAEASP